MSLSIVIPARNEMFLARTIQDILEKSEADTEVIAVLDGSWAEPSIPLNDRVNVIYVPEPIGQRAACNLGVRLSKREYIMKVDAHCSFDQGFDRKMLEDFPEDVTMVPVMRNLWAFDWKCYHCGWKKYQGPTPEKCGDCGKSDKIRRKMIWKGKERPQSKSYCFDTVPHFQYFKDYSKRPEVIKQAETGYTETMSLQGSCFMVSRDNFWKWNLCEESFGEWGSQGIEVACKTWFSGGRVLVNHKTWYAHMFRTQGGDFGFPYRLSGRKVEQSRKYAKEKFFDKRLAGLVEKFWPIPGWTEEDLNKLREEQWQT